MTLLNYRKALVAVVAAAFFSNLALYLMNNGLSPLTVTHVTLALAVASLPLLLRLPRREAMPLPLVGWCLGFLAISVAFVLGATTYLGELDHFWDRLFGIFFILLMLLIFSDRRVHRFAAGAIGCVLLASVGLNIYEAFNPGTFSPSLGRSAGLYENPNQSGAALVLAMILSLEVAGPRARVALAMLTGLGVALTFSRSAIVGWFLATCLAFGLRRQLGRLAYYGLAMGVAAAALVMLVRPDVVGELEYVGMLNRNTAGRASMEIGSGSDASRLAAAQLAMDLVADSPLLGMGTGASSEPPFDRIGPHNIYLALMVDHGLLGGLIYPLLLVAALWGAARDLRAVVIPFGGFLGFWGLFSHNVLDERYILVAVSLVASMVAAGRARRGEAPGRGPS